MIPNTSQTSTNFITGAVAGVDIISGQGAALSLPENCRGWKYVVVSVEAIIASFTDSGDTDSTGIVGTTLSAGTLISANGLFTAVTLTSGTIVAIRG